MKYKGYIRGDVIIEATPLSAPDGTAVDIFIPSVEADNNKGQEKRSVAEKTFGMIRSDPQAIVARIFADYRPVYCPPFAPHAPAQNPIEDLCCKARTSCGRISS